MKKKVILICHGGQSTSILAQRVKEESNNEIEIEAFSINTFMDNVEGVKIILVAPQMRFSIPEIKIEAGDDFIIEALEPRTYGLMDGKAVTKKIDNLYKKYDLEQ